MNRFKLVCLLIILSIVGILLGQNRELLSLKLFCPDVESASCLYRTPALPLAAWIGLFAIAGMISSLLWQFLNRLATPAPQYSDRKSSRFQQDLSPDRPPRKPSVDFTSPKTVTRSSTMPTSDWEESQNEDWENGFAETKRSDRKVEATNSFEKERVYGVENQTPDVAKSGSTYSYKFREAKPKKREDEPSQDNKVDEVYDANYRTVSPPINNAETVKDDEEWI